MTTLFVSAPQSRREIREAPATLWTFDNTLTPATDLLSASNHVAGLSYATLLANLLLLRSE